MSVYECMDLYTRPHSLNHLLLYPRKQQGLRCFLPVWPATVPPNSTADTISPFCTYNGQGPEHSEHLGTTATEIHIYIPTTQFFILMLKSESMTKDHIPKDLHPIPLSLIFCYAKMLWKSKAMIMSQKCIFLFPSNNTHLLLNQS